MRVFSRVIYGLAALALIFMISSCGDCVIMSVDEVPPKLEISLSAPMIFLPDTVNVDISVSDDYLIKCVEVNLNGDIYKVLKEDDWSFEIPSDDLDEENNLIEAIVYDSFNNSAKASARIRILDDFSLNLSAKDSVYFGNDLVVSLSASARDTIECLSYGVWRGSVIQDEAFFSDTLEVEADLQFYNGEMTIICSEYDIGDYSYRFVLISENTDKIFKDGEFSVIKEEEEYFYSEKMNLNQISEVLK